MGERSRDNDNNNNDKRSGEQRSNDNDNNPQQSSDGVDGPSCGLNNAPTKGEPSNDNDNNNPRQSTDDADGPVCGLNNAPTKSEEQSNDNENNAHSKSEERSNDNDNNTHSKSEERSNENDNNAHSKSEERYNDNDNNITTSSEDNTMRGDGELGADHHNEQPQHENTKEEPFVEKDNNQRMGTGNSPPSSQGSPPCNTTNDTSRPQFNDNSKNEPPDKKTSEGDNSDNQTPPTGSKTTDQEPSSASQFDDKTTDEASADNDNPMCVLNNVPSESLHSNVTSDNKANKTVQNDNPMCVLDNAPSPSPTDGRNSGASNAQQKTHGQQQYVDDENDMSIHNNTSSSHKSQSYSHQLRTNTGTNIKRHRPQLQNKHSLDDTAVTNNYHGVSDYEDDDFDAYETGDGSASGAGSSIIYGNSSYEYSTPADGQSLPEFVGNDSNAPDIFKAPRRAAVHPNRPQFVELRPHPLRETQVGKFLRTIASTDKQLWAGQECGVRVWRLSDAYTAGIGVGGRARRGDEDAAPFYESVTTPPAMCLMIDSASKLVWSGHKDGKIRSWNMDIEMNDNPFHEGLSWQAHRGPVLTMVISSYGDLWTGSEGGVIHVYPWEAIDKSISLKIEERHMASLLVERSCVNLRTQVTINGVCNISSQDVKVLLCDKVVAKVWAFGTYSISLWDARTRELIKVYNVDGHIENRADMPQVQDQGVEDEINVKLVSKSKKEKPHGFLQRSRNAIMGAAGAVRRAATKSGNEESKTKTEAVVLASNGMIYSGCTNGLIVQWDGNGTRLQEFNHHPCAVLCLCTYGSRIWVGYVSGMVQVLDLDGSLIAGWVAHNGPVIKMVVGNGHVFSLATHGGIRGWNIASPGPLDQIIRPELAKKELCYTRRENIKILVGTWNVGQGKPSHDALMTWVGSAVSDVGIFVVGLQEVEMGAGFLAMSAAKETVGLEGSSIGHLWQDAIGKSLGEGSLFERVGSRQLAGLLIAIWVRTSIRTYVGDLDAGAVACGLGRTFGNKGGVGLRLRVYDRIMCFVNCHFAAHLEAVNRRNADFSHIYRSMAFSRSSNVSNNASAGVSSSAQGLRGTNTMESNPGKGKPDLAEADMVIFCGDFNYRLFGISYDDARDLVSQRSFDWLRERDQLRAEMKAGKVFQGMREAIIRFTPTYKFDRGKPGLGGYDSGEKKRIPAWCDRILYRDNRSSSAIECSLECPVVASILQYDSCMDVLESDHKPVRCKLNVEIAHVDRSKRRQEMGKIINSHEAISSLRNELCFVPKTDVSTKRIVLKNQDTSSLKITNKSATDKAIFQIICEGQAPVQEDGQPLTYNPRGAFGFPRWLEVIPASGVIAPDQVADIIVRHDDVHTMEQLVDGLPQTWSAEDTRDKEVLLKVVLIGCCSLETKSHTVQVHYCYSPKATQTDSSKGGDSLKGSGSKKHHGSTHNRNRSDNDESKSSHGSEKKSKS